MLRFVAILHDAKPVGRGLQVKELLRAPQELPRRPWGETNHASRLCAAEKCHACASNPPPELEDGRDLPGFDGRLHGPERLGQGLHQLLDPVSNGGVVDSPLSTQHPAPSTQHGGDALTGIGWMPAIRRTPSNAGMRCSCVGLAAAHG